AGRSCPPDLPPVSDGSLSRRSGVSEGDDATNFNTMSAHAKSFQGRHTVRERAGDSEHDTARAAAGGPTGAVLLEVVLTPAMIVRFLLLCIGVLLLAGTIVAALAVGFGVQNRLTHLFDLDVELSIPAFFSALMLLAAGCLLAAIALEHTRRARGWQRHWWLLSFVFFCLAFDEAASIHEVWNPIARQYFGLSSLRGPAWTVPMLAVLAVLAVVMVPFLRALPRRYLRLFLAVAMLYLGGAVVVELIGGVLEGQYGELSWPYHITVIVEEGLEMLGVAVFIYGLADYPAELGLVAQVS